MLVWPNSNPFLLRGLGPKLVTVRLQSPLEKYELKYQMSANSQFVNLSFSLLKVNQF